MGTSDSLKACMLAVSVVAETQPCAFYASRDTAKARKSHLQSAHSVSSFHPNLDDETSPRTYSTSNVCSTYLYTTPKGVRVSHPWATRLPCKAVGEDHHSLRRSKLLFPLRHILLRHLRDLDSLATFRIPRLAHLLLNWTSIPLYTPRISQSNLPPTTNC